MDIQPDNDLVEICREIVRENRIVAEWSAVESDDTFQVGPYQGGFDSIEDAFCFSAYTTDDEFCFQFTLKDAMAMAAGEMINSRQNRKNLMFYPQ